MSEYIINISITNSTLVDLESTVTAISNSFGTKVTDGNASSIDLILNLRLSENTFNDLNTDLTSLIQTYGSRLTWRFSFTP